VRRADVRDAGAHGDPAWLRADGWRLYATPRWDEPAGEELERFEVGGRVVSARVGDSSIWVPFSLDEALENYISERWRRAAETRALSPLQLAFFYRVKKLVPRALQLALRRALIRWQGLPAFPTWPLDDSVAHLLRFYARCLAAAEVTDVVEFRWFWPDGRRSALVLTHDVESAEGLRLAPEIADLEEERGFRSSFNVVGRRYPIDHGILAELRRRGFEIGVHGVYHDRSLFSSRDAFETQLPLLREMAQTFGARGFRSPATHRVFEWLADLPFSYDCSVPHSDPYEPQPGGCCSLWPFFVGSVLELPWTMPQDHTLFTLLRHRTPELWLRQAEHIHDLNGLIQVLTHPDPGYLGTPAKRTLYASFLDAVADRSDVWRALPRELDEWWRERDAGGGGGRIVRGVAHVGRTQDEVRFEPQAAYL
jgi:peptidoglycan/xylan/chitin deacetylase (PgdA/CDA1 family)